MAELAAKFADSTFVVEQDVESVPEAVPESISTSETAGKELKEEDHMTEVTEPQESIKTEDLAAPKVPENSVPVPGSVEESLVLPAEESEEVKVQSVEPPVAKEAFPETVNESKAVDTIVPKLDHPICSRKLRSPSSFRRAIRARSHLQRRFLRRNPRRMWNPLLWPRPSPQLLLLLLQLSPRSCHLLQLLQRLNLLSLRRYQKAKVSLIKSRSHSSRRAPHSVEVSLIRSSVLLRLSHLRPSRRYGNKLTPFQLWKIQRLQLLRLPSLR